MLCIGHKFDFRGSEIEANFLKQSNAAKTKLRKELSNAGLRPTETLNVLPDWWEDAIRYPSGLYEIKGFIAKTFGLVVSDSGELVSSDETPEVCYKRSANTELSDMDVAANFGAAILSSVSRAYEYSPRSNTSSYESLPAALDLRNKCLINGAEWIGLKELLSICWSYGIPVVYAPKIPAKKAKMHGMACYQNGRPSILISKKANADHSAWVLYTLAHEIGHIFHGHVGVQNRMIVDEEVYESESIDQQEVEANIFANTLLTGGQEYHLGRLQKAEQFASQAESIGKENRIDPGHIVLNAVSNTQINGKPPWSLGVAALRHIKHGFNAPEKFKGALLSNIDLDDLSSGVEEMFEKLDII